MVDFAQARQVMGNLPYCRALGIEIVDLGPGWAELVIPYRDDLIGDPATGVLHGGAVSALMDSTCGTAVICHPDGGVGTATLDLRIDYLRGATPGQALRARAECIRVTRTIAFVRGTAHDDDTGSPVATATAAFTVPGAAA
ncbi:MAG: PaaI family thioesterase [Rhodobacteraceae bacterium]|nr:PaaI family thioesterase [Paracoccaceae bacterium]